MLKMDVQSEKPISGCIVTLVENDLCPKHKEWLSVNFALWENEKISSMCMHVRECEHMYI